MWSCRRYVIDAALDIFEDLPVIPAVCTACHTIAAVDQQLTRRSRNGQDAKDQSKGQCAGAGEVLAVIQADFQSQRSLVEKIDVDLVGVVVTGCLSIDIAGGEAGRGYRKFPRFA